METKQTDPQQRIDELERYITALELRIQRIEKEVALDRPQPAAVLALANQTRPRPSVNAR